MAADQVIYLEKFIESTAHAPPELQRILNTIKDLDERSEDLGAQIQDNVDIALQAKLTHDEVKEVLERVDADQRLLIQFAEEKVQLALRGYDVLDRHLTGLETDAAALTEELQANARLADALGEGGFGGGSTPAFDELAPGTTGRIARLRDLSSFDSLDAAGSEFRPGRRSALAISRHPSEEGLAFDGITPGPPTRRPPSAAGRRTPQASGIGGVEVGSAGGSHIPKRRAASAAVHAAAAAVAAMDEDDGVDPAAAGVAPGGVAFATPLLPGFDHAAEQPQAPGRLLTTPDIGPGLVGRRAELYWPDNNLWYLIEVRGVDLAARTASILYTTGEVEELDLDEIVKEGHLSLITSLRSTRG